MNRRIQSWLSKLLAACALCLITSGCQLGNNSNPDWRLLYINDQGEVEREPGRSGLHVRPAYIRTETRRPIGISTDRLDDDVLRAAQRQMTVEALEIAFSKDAQVGSDRRARAVAAISEMKKLKSLDVSVLAASELHNIGHLPELKSLHCCGDMEAEGLVDFLKRHPAIESLHLHGTAVSGGLELLSASPQLRALDWYPEKTITEEELQYLRFVPELQELRIHRVWSGSAGQLTDNHLRHFRVLGNLRRLELASAQVTDEGLRYLADLPHLESLKMPLEGDGLRSLGKMAALREFVVCEDKSLPSVLETTPIAFNEENLDFLADASNLISLKLPRGITITDASASALSRMKNLKQLEIPGSAMTAAGYRVVFDRPDQSILDLTIPISDEVIEVLAARSAVERLDVRAGKTSAEGFRKLSELKSLKYLSLLGDWERLENEVRRRYECKADDVVAFARSRPDIYIQDARFIQGRRVVEQRPPCGCVDDLWENILRAVRRDDAFVQAREDAEEKWKRSQGLR